MKATSVRVAKRVAERVLALRAGRGEARALIERIVLDEIETAGDGDESPTVTMAVGQDPIMGVCTQCKRFFTNIVEHGC